MPARPPSSVTSWATRPTPPSAWRWWPGSRRPVACTKTLQAALERAKALTDRAETTELRGPPGAHCGILRLVPGRPDGRRVVARGPHRRRRRGRVHGRAARCRSRPCRGLRRTRTTSEALRPGGAVRRGHPAGGPAVAAGAGGAVSGAHGRRRRDRRSRRTRPPSLPTLTRPMRSRPPGPISCTAPTCAAPVNVFRRGNSCAPLTTPSRRWTSRPGCNVPSTNLPPRGPSRVPADPSRPSRSPPRRRGWPCHAAKGLSNKEIAAALFLSPKTVEHHLSSVYRKRGFRSRAELAGSFRPRSV